MNPFHEIMQVAEARAEADQLRESCDLLDGIVVRARSSYLLSLQVLEGP